MAGEISHRGVVKQVDAEKTLVEIVSASACASCRASALCTAFESARKEVVVPTDSSLACVVGDEVEVVLSPSMGRKAVWISYVIPLGILLFFIVSLSGTRLHEALVALIGLAAMALYYLGVYLLRARLADDYAFSIRK